MSMYACAHVCIYLINFVKTNTVKNIVTNEMMLKWGRWK